MQRVPEQVSEQVSDCSGRPAWSLTEAELRTSLDVLQRQATQIAARQLELIRELDGRGNPAGDGATSTAAWLRDRLRISGPTARRTVALASAVDRHIEVATAMSDGAVNVEQAAVIVDALSRLPVETAAEQRAKAGTALIGYALDFEPDYLRALGSRILQHVAPELAEIAEARALEQAEKRAYDSRTFALTAQSDGRVRLTGWLHAEAAATVATALDPLTNPARRSAGDSGDPTGTAMTVAIATEPRAGASDVDGAVVDDRSPGQRRADALVEICGLAMNAGELPENGGDRTQLVVTINHADLVNETGAGMLDNGSSLTPQTVRRVACDAEIIPAVLGGQGQVLDVGRARRLFTGPLRRALVLRDSGCAFPSCDRPPRWCDGHHVVPWLLGGRTDLENAVLLCKYHHRVIHQGGWAVLMGPDRLPTFVPPVYVDRDQRPRRNHYWRRP